MRIIEIEALPNGAHENQTMPEGLAQVPTGWAIIPDELTVPSTFPFVSVEVEAGVVVSMLAGTVPETPDVPEVPSASDDVDAMIVDHEYRLTLLELGVTEEV